MPPLTDAARRSPVLTLAERVLGIDSTGKRQLFPTYTELPTKIPLRVWQGIRVASIAGYFGLIAMMFVQPAAGLLADCWAWRSPPRCTDSAYTSRCSNGARGYSAATSTHGALGSWAITSRRPVSRY